MNPQPKIKPKRNPKYLDYIRMRPCIFCGGQSEPHHVRRHYWGAGASIKPHDYVCLPVCRTHHEAKFEMDIDINKVITRVLIQYAEEKCDSLKFIDCLIDFIEAQR
jgi:hypothetical protein